MERLERKIRKELIEEKTDELYQDMLTPEYTAKMKDLVEGYINGLLAGVKEMVSPSELAIFEIEMKAQMNKNVFEPSALKKQAVQAAKRYYGSRAETEYMLESERSKLEGLINTEAMEKIKDAETPFLAVTDINNRFITGLVEIAKKQGIEAALATETRDRVYRQIFPTALEYTAFCNSVIETVKQYAGCITDAVSELDMSEITGPLTNLIAKSVEFAQEKYLKKAEQDAKRIYGGK